MSNIIVFALFFIEYRAFLMERLIKANTDL
jgi:hypothetical protein